MSGTLAFVSDRRQLDAVRALPGFDGAVATARAGLLLEDDLAPQRLTSLWDRFPSGREREHVEAAHRLCDLAGEALRGRFIVAGCDLIDAVRHDLVCAALFTLNLKAATERVLEELHPSAIVRFDVPGAAVLWDSTDTAAQFSAVVGCVARRAGCSETLLPEERTSGGLVETDRVLPLVGSGARAPATRRGSTRHLSICHGPLGIHEQERLLAQLPEAVRDGWFLWSEPQPDLALPQLSPRMLLRLPRPAACSSAAFQAAALALPGALVREHGDAVDAIFADDGLALLWRSVGDWLEAAAQWSMAGGVLARGLRPATAVISSSGFGAQRALTRALEAADVRTLSIHHTGLNLDPDHPVNRNRGACGAVAVWGPVDAAYVEKGAGPGIAAIQTGSLRPDIERLLATPRQVRAVPAPAAPRVVLFTGESADFFDFGASFVLHRKVWRDLRALVVEEEAWTFTIKPHPGRDYYAFYDAMAAGSGGRLRVDRRPAADVLAAADVAVLVTYPSTVAADAIMSGVPVVFLREAVNPSAHPALKLLEASTVADVRSLVRRLCEDPVFRTETVSRERAGICDTIAASGEEAVGRVFASLEALAADRADRQPDPAAAWLLELVRAVEEAARGRTTATTFRARMTDLRHAGRDLRFDTLGLDDGGLGEALLDLVTWSPWPAWSAKDGGGRSVPLASLVWHLFRSLPASIRPARRKLREHLAQTLCHDVEHGDVRTACLAAVLALVSPGRFVAHLRRGAPAGRSCA